jgi:tryptophan-rich sensory protein
MLLAGTPLPTYISVWGRPVHEQIQRVESISYEYLLLNLIANSVWTSYAFKTQNIDLAIISVVPLVVTIVLLTIYLSIKPKAQLIK